MKNLIKLSDKALLSLRENVINLCGVGDSSNDVSIKVLEELTVRWNIKKKGNVEFLRDFYYRDKITKMAQAPNYEGSFSGKLAAIKQVRTDYENASGERMGLKEAKDYVEYLTGQGYEKTQFN